jgi:hypothetical protein
MFEYKLRLAGERPYFAELPYALWGDVNYNSEGDCRRPTDRAWTWLQLTHRETGAEVTVDPDDGLFRVRSDDGPLAAQTAAFLLARAGGEAVGADPRAAVGDWSVDDALLASARVRAEFPRPELVPFDDDVFWGSWKWVGPTGTTYTWVGRWIMNAVLHRDPRAVLLCIDWLADGTYNETQSAGLRAALAHLTGEAFSTDAAWVSWYREGGGSVRFPEPDYDAWYLEMKGN